MGDRVWGELDRHIFEKSLLKILYDSRRLLSPDSVQIVSLQGLVHEGLGTTQEESKTKIILTIDKILSIANILLVFQNALKIINDISKNI